MRMEHSENFKAVLEEKTREAESIIAVYLPKASASSNSS